MSVSNTLSPTLSHSHTLPLLHSHSHTPHTPTHTTHTTHLHTHMDTYLLELLKRYETVAVFVGIKERLVDHLLELGIRERRTRHHLENLEQFRIRAVPIVVNIIHSEADCTSCESKEEEGKGEKGTQKKNEGKEGRKERKREGMRKREGGRKGTYSGVCLRGSL